MFLFTTFFLFKNRPNSFKTTDIQLFKIQVFSQEKKEIKLDDICFKYWNILEHYSMQAFVNYWNNNLYDVLNSIRENKN